MDIVKLYNLLLIYKVAYISFFVTIVALFLFKKYFLFKLYNLAKKTKLTFDDLLIDIVEGINSFYILVISIFVATRFIQLNGKVSVIINFFIYGIFLFFVVKSMQKILDYYIEKLIKVRLKRHKEQFDPSPFRVLNRVLKNGLWVFAILIFLQNLGYNVSALLAGVGIGGVAVAFALQNILEDIFSYFSIYFDKPFMVGDFLDINGKLGTVSYIGIKSTRLTTLQGEELVIPNKILTSSNVHNYKKMKERRVTFSFGILYETPVEKIKKIPQIIEEIINEIDIARFDRAHFNNFGDSSLDFEVVYFMLTDDYKQYMDTQQKINLKMIEKFANLKIEFAYPTKTVLLKHS